MVKTQVQVERDTVQQLYRLDNVNVAHVTVGINENPVRCITSIRGSRTWFCTDGLSPSEDAHLSYAVQRVHGDSAGCCLMADIVEVGRVSTSLGQERWHQVDRVLPQFGGVQSRPRKALDLDFMGDGLGVADAEVGAEAGVYHGGYIPLRDDEFGGGTISPHQLYPDFASPGTMKRQLGGEICYADLAVMWAQDAETSASQLVLETPQIHVDLNCYRGKTI
ncbi:hypothetical protein PIB30_041023 [Stylosanthes scabra]|uniref:Uncharacterized protein n=1 Tax=Stylosanthes scabra TaxID=79078 RepID=A0ABU6ZDH5_9FABA|nr:hypothetical protein [Stylosanthes scabra]